MDVTNSSIFQQSPPLATLLGFEPVTSTLTPLIWPQALSILLKVIVVRKGAYPNLIVHSPKRPRHLNTKGVDGHDQSSYLPTPTILDIIVLEIARPSTILPSPTPLPIETTIHYTLAHVTQLDVCPPRRQCGPHKHQVLPFINFISTYTYGDIVDFTDRFDKYVFVS